MFRSKEPVIKNISVAARKTNCVSKAAAQSFFSKKTDNYFVYTPTSIWQTRHSEFWQWQRLSEWWNEFNQDKIIIPHTKRHILV